MSLPIENHTYTLVTSRSAVVLCMVYISIESLFITSSLQVAALWTSMLPYHSSMLNSSATKLRRSLKNRDEA